MQERELEELVRKVIAEMGDRAATESSVSSRSVGTEKEAAPLQDDGAIPDISAIDYRFTYDVPNAENPEEFRRLKERTWARIGLGRVGPRYKTGALLRFWADNALASDAVFTDVDQRLLDDLGLWTVETKCSSKDEFLTRPDLGAQFEQESLAEIEAKCVAHPDVQIYVADGLSSTAVEANLRDLLPAMRQGLELHGLSVGTPFYVRFGRVRSMEPIAQVLKPKVICVLLGERPGLASVESLSAYIAYDAQIGMSESFRTCVSNIHQHGTNAVEAGAHIADVIKMMIDQKASGVNLKH